MAQGPKPIQFDRRGLGKSLLIWLLVGGAVLLVTRVGVGNIWHEGLIRPMLNALLFLYANLGHSFVVAIAAFTLVLRLITFPLTLKQIRSSRKMALVQPRVAELQKKYGGDKQRLAQEQQKIYKEAGINPLGGCLPTLVQFPIWIGLYQSINSLLADQPIEMMALGKNVYAGFRTIVDLLPIQSHFLWLNLAKPDPTPFVLPVLVAGTMWLQQKMMTQPSTDAQQASMNQTMQLMMPLMFGYFTTQFASGLALYFVVSNVVGIVMQWATERIEGPVTPGAKADSAKSMEKVANGKQTGRNAKR